MLLVFGSTEPSTCNGLVSTFAAWAVGEGCGGQSFTRGWMAGGAGYEVDVQGANDLDCFGGHCCNNRCIWTGI